MKTFKIVVKSNGKTMAQKAVLAESFFQRLKGLMFSERMEGFDALVIKSCNSIHTFFMKYSIDVVFLNKELKIIKIKRGIQPWRITPMYFSATQAVEFQRGYVDESLKEGENLEFVCTS